MLLMAGAQFFAPANLKIFKSPFFKRISSKLAFSPPVALAMSLAGIDTCPRWDDTKRMPSVKSMILPPTPSSPDVLSNNLAIGISFNFGPFTERLIGDTLV